MSTHVALGLLLSLTGGASLYLTSPHQRWREAPLASRPWRVVGGLLLGAGLIPLCLVLHVASAIFTFVSWTMLLFVAFPYLGALRPRARASGRSR